MSPLLTTPHPLLVTRVTRDPTRVTRDPSKPPRSPIDPGPLPRRLAPNRVAADGPLVVWPDGPAGVARLRPARPVELHFHRNGVRVADGNDPQGNGGLARAGGAR